MDFTTNFLRAKGPCAAGFRWYVRHQQQPTNGYQHVLDALVDAGRVDDACWLLDQLGPTNTLLEVDRLDAPAVVFAGAIRARRGIDVGGVLRAGRSIACEGALAARTVAAGGEVHATGPLESAGPLTAAGVRARWIDVRGPVRASGDVRAADALRCGSFEGAGDLVARGSVAVDGGLRCEGRVKVAGDVECGGAMHVRLGVECGGSVRCGGPLDAGWGVRAGGCVVAAAAIRAGESIRAGGELRAGPGYGIYAGTAVAIEDWATSAVVCACTRPRNLVSGDWQGADLVLGKGRAR
ncbi:hypothetical protein [Ramlibacter humi]|uniref:DUF342 domain-containing protein n=1 Tax=Ramlibacter humi TaxID=2530451 RepID=A0A4Z0BKT3_9BURK|nr:hypothetical protein [Ramlibacter humi]TFY99033.1 hypothetical protein EZ216_15850 [Ramlibacter humi]